MKWAAVMLAIVVAGAVSAYAIYTFRPQTEDTTDADGARATLFARSLMAQCKSDCEPTEVRRIAGPIWHARVGDSCFRIDIENFSLEPYQGVSLDECD